MKEIFDSILEVFKSRITNRVYGIFFSYWTILHWDFIYSVLFLDQDSILLTTGLLKNEYLMEYLFGCKDLWFYISWISPFALTYLTIWHFQKWIFIPAFEKDEQAKADKEYSRKSVKNSLENKLKDLEVEDLGRQQDIKKAEKLVDREVLWEKEYKELSQNQDFRERLSNIVQSVYQWGGHVLGYDNTTGKRIRMSTDVLAFADANDLINIVSTDDGELIDLKEKGKFFIKKFLAGQGLKIIEAKYGKNDTHIDITEVLNKLIRNNRLSVIIGNELVGGDPLKGVNKEAIIKYEYNGKLGTVIVPEYQSLQLPDELPNQEN